MTKAQIRRNSNAVLREVAKNAKQEIWRLINSGAIDFSGEDMRSFEKAKCLVRVALENTQPNFEGFLNFDKEVKNLRKF